MPQSTLPMLAAALLMPVTGWAHPAGQSGEHNDDHEAHISVNGSPHHVEIVEKDGYRLITSNGIPDHTPGNFPTRGNPNAISAQDYTFRMPLDPQPADEAGENFRGPGPGPRALFGVALNGVPFDPGTAELWSPKGRVRGPAAGNAPRDGWRYEAITGNIDLGLDQHNAHVQPTGAYHYHALPVGVYEKLAGKAADQAPDQMVHLGYAADGYPIYGIYGHEVAADPDSPLIKLQPSWKIKDGPRPAASDTSPGGDHDGTFVQDWEFVAGLGDLDQHNGRPGVTPEYPGGTYYYVVSADYPFVPRSFYGTPDESFMPKGGPHGEERGERGERPKRQPPPR